MRDYECSLAVREGIKQYEPKLAWLCPRPILMEHTQKYHVQQKRWSRCYTTRRLKIDAKLRNVYHHDTDNNFCIVTKVPRDAIRHDARKLMSSFTKPICEIMTTNIAYSRERSWNAMDTIWKNWGQPRSVSRNKESSRRIFIPRLPK